MDEINKMFEVWLEQHKRSCGNDTFTNRELNGYKDAFIAGATFMAEEIERIINKYGVNDLDAGDILGFIQELKK